MTPACNQCRQPMSLASDALVPMWRCTSCHREVPRWPNDLGLHTRPWFLPKGAA